MNKREELESRRNQMDKEISKDNGLNTFSLYERSVLIGKLIRLFGTVALILCIGYAIYCFIFVASAIVFRVITSICLILSGFVLKVVFEWFSLVLLNLAELNNK